MLPLPVLEQAAAEMLCANGTGQSVMEMSHRSKEFTLIIEETERLLREILCVPPDYSVLFLQGGATLQFSMLPINLGGVEERAEKRAACYIDTGVWAGKAAEEAKKYLNVRIGASSKDRNYVYIPSAPPPDTADAYYHICLNNTIMGTKWSAPPDTGAIPLAADVSSCILSEPLDVSRFGLIYAGAQKNLGPAGCTLVIVRNDLIGRAPSWTPLTLRYDVHAREKSLLNTPPCWSIYIINLTLKWIRARGGLPAIARANQEKAALLYDSLERSSLFRLPVEKEYRSLMNVVFTVNEPDAEKRRALEARFLKEAGTRGLINLAGHKLAGGLRASIYNAMPPDGVRALVSFIEEFERSV